jgi:hypothetical protein
MQQHMQCARDEYMCMDISCMPGRSSRNLLKPHTSTAAPKQQAIQTYSLALNAPTTQVTRFKLLNSVHALQGSFIYVISKHAQACTLPISCSRQHNPTNCAVKQQQWQHAAAACAALSPAAEPLHQCL